MVLYVSKKKRAPSSADRVPGYEPVGRGFESPGARHNQETTQTGGFLVIMSSVLDSTLLCKCNAFANRVRKRAYISAGKSSFAFAIKSKNFSCSCSLGCKISSILNCTSNEGLAIFVVFTKPLLYDLNTEI